MSISAGTNPLKGRSRRGRSGHNPDQWLYPAKLPGEAHEFFIFRIRFFDAAGKEHRTEVYTKSLSFPYDIRRAEAAELNEFKSSNANVLNGAKGFQIKLINAPVVTAKPTRVARAGDPYTEAA